SKWEIFVESLRYSVKLAYDRQLAELGEIADPVERLRALVQMQMPHAQVERREWSIWVQMWSAAATSETAQAEHANSYSRWERTVRDIVAECIEASAFRPLTLETTVLTLTGLIDGLGIRVMSGLLSPADMRATVLHHNDDHLVAPPDIEDDPG